jgi:hypothetical protein
MLERDWLEIGNGNDRWTYFCLQKLGICAEVFFVWFGKKTVVNERLVEMSNLKL